MSMQGDVLSRAANMRGRPAVTVALFFIAGIVIAHILPPDNYALLFSTFGVLIIIFGLFFLYKSSYFGILALLLFSVIGYVKYSVETGVTIGQHESHIAEPERNVLIWGTITGRPQLSDDRSRFILRADSLFDGTTKIKTTGDLLTIIRPDARYDRSLLDVEYGDYVLVHGSISLPAGRRNPYEPDFNRYLELQNIDAMVFVRGNYNVEVQGVGRANRFITSVIVPIRSYIGEVIDRNLSGESAHFLRGLLLGDRSRISDDVRETFIAAGVIHVLAVSGLHVGIMSVIFFSVFGFFRVPRVVRIMLTIAGLIVYMFVTGAAPSVVRATIMASIILAGFLLQRKSDIYNSIAVAALVLLFFDSRELFKPAFQLSFAAVLSIVYLYPRFWDGIRHRFPRIEENWFTRYIIQLLLVTCAAQLGTLPFTAYYFERVSLVAFGANLLVIPGIFFVLSFGFASVISGLASSFLERMYGYLTEFLLSTILRLVDLVSQLSFASVDIFHFTIINGMLFYSIIAVIVHLTQPYRFRFAVIGLAIVMNIYIIDYNLSFNPERNQPLLRMTMLDVGQGDALLVEFPDGSTMLYDAGPRTFNNDAGERTVVPFLRRHGVTALDAIVISHAHADHYGGLEAVLREVDVGVIYDSGQKGSGEWYNSLINKINSLDIPVEIIQAGDIIDTFDNVRIYVVHPAPAFVQRNDGNHNWNINNASIVFMIVYGNVRLLITGDAEQEAEYYMTYYYDDFLDSDILKAGHHGSNTSSTDQFVSVVSPEKALISVGRMNRFNHPGDDVMRRFEEGDINIYRTDMHGAVTIKSCGEDYWITTMR